MQLIKWDKIRTEIECAKDIETLTAMKDKLRAYQILAEQSKQSQEVQAKIAIYKARVDRKCGEWLKENVELGRPEKRSSSSTIILKDIGITKDESSRLQKIASIPADKFEGILQEAEVETQKVTSNMLVKIAKEAEKQERFKNLKPQRWPEGKYRVIYADPPWQFDNSGLNESAESYYPTIPTNQICQMNIKNLTTPESVLFLWATNAMLEDALLVCKDWGFRYKTNIVWIKEKGPSIGWFTISRHELLLIATRENNTHPIEKPISWFNGSVSQHSKKPVIVYEKIEKMYKGPYIELFARNKRQGWESYGNQISEN